MIIKFILYIKILIKKGIDVIMPEILNNGIEVTNTSIFYAKCIQDGIYTFAKVPKRFKLETAIVLCTMSLEELVTDENYLSQAKEKIEQAEANIE